MSAAARSAAGANHARLMRGDRLDAGVIDALFLAQEEQDLIARGFLPGVAATLASRELEKLKKAAA